MADAVVTTETPRKENAEYVIIGGGVLGLSVAYHLAKVGVTDVLLLERNQLTSGTSWHAAGIVGPLRANINLTKLAVYGTELFQSLEGESGQATGYMQTGGYWLAQTDERLEELERIAGLGALTGLNAGIVTPDEIAEHLPQIQTTDLAGGLFVAEDGQVNPVDLCMAYARVARNAGVRIRENSTAASLEVSGDQVRGVVLADGSLVSCGSVIVCAGAWSGMIKVTSGPPLRLPVQAVEHMYIVSEPLPDAPTPFPILRDLDSRIYIKGDAGKLVLGGFEPNAKPWNAAGSNGSTPFLELPEDWEQFEPFMMTGLHRWPALSHTGVQHFMNGPESFTPDTRQIMGPAPGIRNLFVAAGMNSIGIMSSAGVGRVMAEWMIDGVSPMDLSDIEFARFDPSAGNRLYLTTRIREAVGDQFAMHWPYKQPTTARGIKRTPLHDELKRAGAVFGAPSGWERPLWFATSEDEKSQRYGYGPQSWWPYAQREAEAVRDAAALFDLTPFTKLDVIGPDALAFLQNVATADVAIPLGRTVYTLLLNARGGIESDVTITRTAPSSYRITSGAASRWRDLSRLKSQQENLGANVHIIDRTTQETVIGLMGPQAQTILEIAGDLDLSFPNFPFGSSRCIDLGLGRARATRLSYVGESGWELSIGNDMAAHCYEALLEVGRRHGLEHAGMLALDACRIEKGFRHWGHDIGSEDTPLEAGLGFAISRTKDAKFIGQDALGAQREQGISRTMIQFAVTEGSPLLLHDEPVYRDNTLVGQTTSGARGFRTGKHMCLAWVNLEPGEGRKSALDGAYAIEVAGRRFPLTALRRPAYDPDGIRMRGQSGEVT